MGSSAIQGQMVRYLVQVLEWLYRVEGWFIAADLNLYRTRSRMEYPVAPDVAVFHGVVVAPTQLRKLRSWKQYEPNRPPPTVVFEVALDTTWESDLHEKPAKYAALGVQEYYAYDPNEPGYFPPTNGRLRAWRLHEGLMVEHTPDAQGRFWSEALQSFLTPDGGSLRLEDADGVLRLTQAEAERAAKEAERAARAQAESCAATERAAKEVEQAAKEAERAAKEVAWAKLRELGIDPTTLS